MAQENKVRRRISIVTNFSLPGVTFTSIQNTLLRTKKVELHNLYATFPSKGQEVWNLRDKTANTIIVQLPPITHQQKKRTITYRNTRDIDVDGLFANFKKMFDEDGKEKQFHIFAVKGKCCMSLRAFCYFAKMKMYNAL